MSSGGVKSSDRVILHVDMDAFFASVEQRDHPEWRGKPVIVGSPPDARGVVSTCSYEARKFGVHSAMPSRTAYALCPNGIFVRGRYDVYEAVSAKVFEIMGHYTPFVEKVSIDEAFLDITGSCHLFGSPRALGEKLRDEIHRDVGITASVGIAPNRLLAKIGSEQNKPNGLFVMPFTLEEAAAFLASRPVCILWGVGKKTAEILSKYGYRVCGDIQNADPRFLERILGATAAASIRSHAFGVASAEVFSEDRGAKSISREYTFETDCNDREIVRSKLLDLVEDVGRRVRLERRWAKVGKLKFRDGSFNTITRQAQFELPARDDITFRHLVLKLFDAVWPDGSARVVRLIGFGVGDFTNGSGMEGPTLFASSLAETLAKRERLSDALDALGPSSFKRP